MLFAVLRWYQKPIKSGLYLLMMAHSLLFALLLYLLFRLNPEDIGLRILIASLSLSSVYLISAIVAAKMVSVGGQSKLFSLLYWQ